MKEVVDEFFTREGLLADLEIRQSKDLEDPGTSPKSILQYKSIQEIYQAFGELCPLTQSEFDYDINTRCRNWLTQLKLGEV